MKKAAILFTILSVLFSFIIGVAADSEPKDIQVILSEIPTVVNLGGAVEITATAPKHGSSFVDSWEGAEKVFTEFNPAEENYTSKAVFKPVKAGTYVISYSITMTSGGSATIFSKKVERTIEVVNPITVVGATAKNLNLSPIYNVNGEILYYRACGQVYALWSDNSEIPTGSSVYFFFGPDETSKDVNVTFSVEGKQYNYTIIINR
jgi:hypothetical protein